MPRMPQYESQRRIESGLGAPIRRDAEASVRTDQPYLKAIQEAGQLWSDANDTMQYTKAKTDYEIAASTIQSEASKDTDPKNIPLYKDRLRDAKNAALGAMDNKFLANQTAIEMDLGNHIAMVKIEAGFRQKQIVENKKDLDVSLNTLTLKSLFSDGEEAKLAQAEIDKLIGINIAAGTITKESADAMRMDARIKAAEYEAVTNPDVFLSRKSSFYDIPVAEYRDAKETAIDTKKQDKKISDFLEDEIKSENETQLVLNLSEKDATKLNRNEKAEIVASVTELILNNEIDKDFGQAYIHAITKGKLKKSAKQFEKKTGFSKYVDQVFKAVSPEEKRKAVIGLLERNSAGNMDANELAVALKSAVVAGDDIKRSATSAVLDFFLNMSPAVQLIRGAVGLTEFGKKAEKAVEEEVKMSADRMTYDFLKGVGEGREIEDAKEEAIENEQKRSNPRRSQYSVGQEVDTPMGTMYVWGYYEDGEPDVRRERPPKK